MDEQKVKKPNTPKNPRAINELSQQEYNKAVIDLAYRYLDIKTCQCGFPLVKGWVCRNCNSGAV